MKKSTTLGIGSSVTRFSTRKEYPAVSCYKLPNGRTMRMCRMSKNFNSCKVDYFGPALQRMKKEGLSMYPPETLEAYRKREGLRDKTKTVDLISINSRPQLSGSLLTESAMPLRLGSLPGEAGTRFTLARVPGRLDDFFLIDDQIFVKKEEMFVPDTKARELLPFELLPSFNENSLVNLAIASGFLRRALRLDPQTSMSHAITGYSSRFAFDFKPHSLLEGEVCHHASGQVEIDAIFLGKRKGRACLFVIEAKTSGDSLAKHKLLYPVLSLLSTNRIPSDMQIIPVYMKANKRERGWGFHVVECTIDDDLCLIVI